MVASKLMGIFGCLNYVYGCIVGSGIFITPRYVLGYTHSVAQSLAIWILCGIVSLLGGISYIELQTGIPRNGGDFSYQGFVGWKGLSFCFMYITAIFTYPASTSVQAVTFGDYVVKGLEHYIYIDDSFKTTLQYFIAIFLLVSCTLMNFGAINKFASKFQIVVTVAKFLVIGVVIAAAVPYVWNGKSKFSEPMEPLPFSAGSFVMALYSGLWSFAGWDVLSYGALCVKNPRKTLPIAIIVGILLVTVTYVSVNLAFFVVLGPQKMLISEAAASDFAEVAMGPFSPFVLFAIPIFLLGTVNAEIFCSSHTIHEAACQRQLPPCLSATNKKTESPRAALLAQLAVSLVMTLVPVESVINYVSFVMWAQKLTSIFALLYIKLWKKEVHDDVLRVPIFIIGAFFLCLVVLVLVPLVTEFYVTIVGILIVSAGLVVYILVIKRKNLPSWVNTLNEFLNSCICKMLNCEIPVVEVQKSEMNDLVSPIDPNAEAADLLKKPDPVEVVDNEEEENPSA